MSLNKNRNQWRLNKGFYQSRGAERTQGNIHFKQRVSWYIDWSWFWDISLIPNSSTLSIAYSIWSGRMIAFGLLTKYWKCNKNEWKAKLLFSKFQKGK
jgi:hypothetical protein